VVVGGCGKVLTTAQAFGRLDSAMRDTKTRTAWTFRFEGYDYNGKPIFMVRRNGESWTRAFSASEARHTIRRYERDGRA